jgi:hypothetical protein
MRYDAKVKYDDAQRAKVELEKKAAAQERQRVKDAIEKDKELRRAEGSGPQATGASSSGSRVDVSECEIRIKLPTGESATAAFAPTAKVRL